MSGSKSKSSATTTTNNADNRTAIQGGALVQTGANVTGLTINDPAAQIAAMDLSRTSTENALISNTLISQASAQAMQNASAAMADSMESIAAGGQAVALAAARASSDASHTSEVALLHAMGVASDAINASAAANFRTNDAAITFQSNATELAQSFIDGSVSSSNRLMEKLISGMNVILSSGADLMKMQSDAVTNIGGQIDEAYQTASDVSTGNRQLVTTGLIVVGIIGAAMLYKGKLA